MGQIGDDGPGTDIPDTTDLGLANSQQAAIRGKGNGLNRPILTGERGMGIALTELPKIAPFEAAQIGLAGTGPVFVEELGSPAEIARSQGLLCQIDVSHVFIEMGGG